MKFHSYWSSCKFTRPGITTVTDMQSKRLDEYSNKRKREKKSKKEKKYKKEKRSRKYRDDEDSEKESKKDEDPELDPEFFNVPSPVG